MATSSLPLSIMSQLALLPEYERDAVLTNMTDEEVAALEYDWQMWGRPNQLPPTGLWTIWLILAGRGFGKSRAGAEQVITWARTPGMRIALVAETAADARDVLVEGESGIVACSPPWFRPKYEPSKRRLTWQNGTVATTYSGDAPDQLRGPQHHYAWADECAKWKYAQDAWDMMELGLRLGDAPQVVATTTPRPIPLIQSLVKEAQDPTSGVIVTRGSTYENFANLAQGFLDRVVKRYEGTRLGRQELHAEILTDTVGSLWTRALLEETRVRTLPSLRRIGIGLDPGGDAGIIAAGIGEDGDGYVFDDLSISGSPLVWGNQTIAGYNKHRANLIVLERNHGADMGKTILHGIDAQAVVKEVWASQGKYARAEPVAALAEQRKIHHVGMFAALEDELCSWVPGEGMPSPNRLDAYVWILTELLLGTRPAPAVSPGVLRKGGT